MKDLERVATYLPWKFPGNTSFSVAGCTVWIVNEALTMWILNAACVFGIRGVISEPCWSRGGGKNPENNKEIQKWDINRSVFHPPCTQPPMVRQRGHDLLGRIVQEKSKGEELLLLACQTQPPTARKTLHDSVFSGRKCACCFGRFCHVLIFYFCVWISIGKIPRGSPFSIVELCFQ